MIGLVAVVGLCTCVDDARAQSPFYLRVGAEMGTITVEHTRKVTIGDGSSSSTSSSTGLAPAGSVAAGLRLGLPGNWLVGGNVIVGREIAGGLAEVYVLGGIRRTLTEFATGATNPETGVAGEDRERLGRWPWSIGAGTTLRLKWPVDFRVRYFRSLTEWVVADETVRLDYRYPASGVLISVGIHVFG